MKKEWIVPEITELKINESEDGSTLEKNENPQFYVASS